MTVSLKCTAHATRGFFKPKPKAKPLDVYKIGPGLCGIDQLTRNGVVEKATNETCGQFHQH